MSKDHAKKASRIASELVKGEILPPYAPRDRFMRQKFTEMRPKIIGGSDIGVITGDNPYKKQLQLKLEKREEVEPDEPNYLMRIGSHMESFIRDDFRGERDDWAFGSELGTIRHREIGHFAASVDDWAVDEAGNAIIIDYKNVSSYGAKKWKNGGLPSHYYAQGQWYMMILKSWVPQHFDACYFRAVVDNRSTELRVITLDEEWIRKATIAANAFWSAMITDDMEYFLQQIDGDEATSEALLAAYPGDPEEERLDLVGSDAEEKINQWCMAYEKARAMQGEIDSNVRRLKSSIQAMMRNATKASTSEFKISWPVVQGRERFSQSLLKKANPGMDFSPYMTKASKYRGGLRITPSKGE